MPGILTTIMVKKTRSLLWGRGGRQTTNAMFPLRGSINYCTAANVENYHEKES